MCMQTTNTEVGVEADIYRKIRRVGEIGHGICVAMLWLIVLVFAGALMMAVYRDGHPMKFALNLGVIKWEVSNFGALPMGVRLWYLLLAGVSLGYTIGGLWILDKLFQSFSRGEVFASGVCKMIIWLGVWNMVPGVCGEFVLLLTGLALIALGWVMQLAVSLKEEQNLTV